MDKTMQRKAKNAIATMLEGNGMMICERDYGTPHGVIDIIALDDDGFHFVNVSVNTVEKRRGNLGAVGKSTSHLTKRINAARAYLGETRLGWYVDGKLMHIDQAILTVYGNGRAVVKMARDISPDMSNSYDEDKRVMDEVDRMLESGDKVPFGRIEVDDDGVRFAG